MGAGGVNPLMAARLRQMMAQRGGPQAQGAAPPSSNAASGQINQALAGLQSVNPQQIVQVLKQMNAAISAISNKCVNRLPGVKRNLDGMGKLFENAIAEAQKAAATQEAAGPPIQNSMASAPAPSQQPPGVVGASGG